jgi:myo-inositol 2-dehydrogenase/D-chiro-inositol 1-dehydrogenase
VAERLGVVAAASAEELYLSEEIDAIAICTSTDTHVAAIVAAADAGKAIFCEKPLSLDLGDVDRALAAVERSGVLFQVGFNRRFDPAHQSVRDAVVAGAIGDVHVVRISSRDPEPPPLDYVRHSGGLFLDMTIHDFDMARYVTGSEVVEVYARGAVRITPELCELGDLDTAVVTLAHAGGEMTVIDNSRQAAYGYDQRLEAFGSLGMAASENPLGHTGLVRTRAGTHTPTLPYFFLERYIPSYLREWDAFVRAFRDGLPSPVGPDDGRAPLVIGLAAARSHCEGRPVRVDEIG